MVAKFVMVNTVKAIGATARVSVRAAYAVGGDFERGWDAAAIEVERQKELTQQCVDKCKADREARIAAAKLRHAAAQAAATATAAPMVSVA